MGLYTAALGAGGYDGTSPGQSAVTESWDGSSWTEVNDMNQARYAGSSAGTQTAGLVAGGTGDSYYAQTETWNGSNWTEVSDLNEGRANIFYSAVGTNTAALAIAGYESPPGQNVASVESWDGSSWTEITDINTARRGGGACGIQTSALAYGGYTTTESANTEAWNGTTWTEAADLATARRFNTGVGTQSAALSTGGRVGTTVQSLTEEWTAPLANKTITSS